MKIIHYCEICETPMENEICCDGFMCGCMGMVVNKPVCSKECDIKWDEKRKLAKTATINLNNKK